MIEAKCIATTTGSSAVSCEGKAFNVAGEEIVEAARRLEHLLQISLPAEHDDLRAHGEQSIRILKYVYAYVERRYKTSSLWEDQPYNVVKPGSPPVPAFPRQPGMTITSWVGAFGTKKGGTIRFSELVEESVKSGFFVDKRAASDSLRTMVKRAGYQFHGRDTYRLVE